MHIEVVHSENVKQLRISTSRSKAMVPGEEIVVCHLGVGGELLPQVEEFISGCCLKVREGWSVAGGWVQQLESLYSLLLVSLYISTLNHGHDHQVNWTRNQIQMAERSSSTGHFCTLLEMG